MLDSNLLRITGNPMPVREFSRFSLENAIVSNDIVVVKIYTAWCSNSQAFAPVFESAAETHPEIVFAKIDADREADLAKEFEIKADPTLMIFREKILVFKEAGAPPPPILEEVIRQAQGLDMDQVRKDIESGGS